MRKPRRQGFSRRASIINFTSIGLLDLTHLQGKLQNNEIKQLQTITNGINARWFLLFSTPSFSHICQKAGFLMSDDAAIMMSCNNSVHLTRVFQVQLRFDLLLPFNTSIIVQNFIYLSVLVLCRSV